ncbi:HvfB family MNIO-type RiPP peptide maturase [Glaesserella parasuis]|uniref:HvfB family MNIO-type RiPP peptide maturase n=1 Tax=Glaesserella parasuis TaxID=738 RepID=UPI0019D16D1B|nr:DUF692 family protein [Glaesserella parasuis]MCT8526460.1 DUF692 family protein [Glaesserella parasuis]MCT8528415.1 DUF692 family protein [Glaesserella parasuis]MCT8529857.1 DUF692 family protein [Glaesserella parasuis]MCT8532157.1 DUF692 family protein [Glaesserella parasuis]MCT8536674.1 DUF692 family protein [Glaesserella parasuis]
MMLVGSGLGYRRDLANGFLQLPTQSAVQFIEIAPENWVKMGGSARYQFDQVAERFPVAVHGLSLSLGGQAPLDKELLKSIKILMKQYGSTFFSEHLSYCECEGHLYDLLPMPFTDEAVLHTAQRIHEVQDYLGLKIALENTSYYLHSPTSTMNEVEFLNAIAQEADCDIHLDVNNIYVNGVNHGLLDPYQFIDQVDHKRVSYIHIAGHNEEQEVLPEVNTGEEAFNKVQGELRHLPQLLIDTHGEKVKGSVWDLLAYTYQRLPHIPPTLLERDFNFPPFMELYAEVEHIARLQRQYAK